MMLSLQAQFEQQIVYGNRFQGQSSDFALIRYDIEYAMIIRFILIILKITLMFADFQNLIKDKLSSLKQATTTDITKTPQKYKIGSRQIQQLKLLSEGSFGFIWLAEDMSTKQKFALKRIVCITNQRFLLAKNQLDLMMKFPKSKNLVQCFGGQMVTLRNGNTQNRALVILMQYCPNGTLFDLLQARQNKGFTQKQLLKIAFSILEGLKNIHKIGCYHQDVKIQNVLVGADNQYKLCDFGSCSNRFIDFRKIDKREYGHIKEEIQAMTTPMYRPPQIVDPYLQFEVGYKVDIWMVGCVLYTLAYFTHPFVDSNAVGIAGGVYTFPKQSKYPISQKINDLIRNILTPNPSFRPSIQQLQHIISNWSTLSQIPLNSQAQVRKKQQMRKQKQMQALHKKVVDIQGDIPIEQLMQIQKKLKNKPQEQVQTKSFVTKKQNISSNQGKPLFGSTSLKSNQGNTVQNNDFFNIGKPQQQGQGQKGGATQQQQQVAKQKQETTSTTSFWNTSSGSNQGMKNASSGEMNVVGDVFANFFTNTTSSNKTTTNNNNNNTNTNNNDIYDYFLQQQPKKAAQSAPSPASQSKKSNQDNLLDL